MSLQRYSVTFSKTLDSTLADTPALEIGSMLYGMITIPTGSTISALTWFVSDAVDGTYVQVYKVDDSAACTPSTVAAARAYPFPTEVYGAKFLKIVPNADGAVKIHLKS
jgi:hypothetical protein